MDTREIIRELGGPANVARRLDLPGNDVGAKLIRAWSVRDSIPAEYFVALAQIARDLDKPNITERTLSEMAHRRRIERAEAPESAAA